MGIQYEKQDKPIYKWTLMADGKVRKLTPITEYTVRSSSQRTRYYMKQADGLGKSSIDGKKLDCFKNNNLYSFDGDDARALKIIRDALKAKVHIYKKEYDKALNDLTKFDTRNSQ